MKAIIALSCVAGLAAALPDDCMVVNGVAESLAPFCGIVTKFCATANDALSNDGMMNDGILSNDGMSNDGLMNDGLVNTGFLADSEFAQAHETLANEALANSGILANLGFDLSLAAPLVHADICNALTECGAFLPGGALAECATAAPEEPCLEIFLGDGVCDEICNSLEWQFDGGDCAAAAPGAETTATSEAPFTFATETATESATATEAPFTFGTETATERCVIVRDSLLPQPLASI